MNVEKIATVFVGGVIAIGLATTIFGRSTTPRVFNAAGNAASALISAALGKGVRLSR